MSVFAEVARGRMANHISTGKPLDLKVDVSARATPAVKEWIASPEPLCPLSHGRGSESQSLRSAQARVTPLAKPPAARITTVASVSATSDMQPPTPDPMQWEVEPYEVKLGGDLEYGATMTAVQAIDDVEGVEYFFECTTRSGFNSGWQTAREYTVLLGRRAQGQRFRVKARDTSSSHNETGWSSEVIAR